MNLEQKKADGWQKADGVSLAALCVAMCSQLDIGELGQNTLKQGLGYASKTFHVALPDLMFALVFVWFVGRTLQLRGWKRLWWPPLPCFALIFALVLSILHSPTIWAILAAGGKDANQGLKRALIETVQWSGYFGIAPWLFVNLMLDRRGATLVARRELALSSFALAVVLSSLWALMGTLFSPDDIPQAAWGSPNAFAAFVALAVPFWVVSPRVTSGGRDWKSVGFFVLLVLLPFAVASPWAIGAILAGLGATFLLPNAHRRLAWVLLFATALALDWTAPLQTPALANARAELGRVNSPAQKVKKQYIEWQAAVGWNSLRERAFATGFGPDNYQLNIGPLYASLPNEEKLPPDSNNLFLVQAVSTGILGLGALLWTFGHFFGLAWHAARQNSGDWLGVAVVASLSSWFFVNFFHAFIVRGGSLILAFLFALAVVASQLTPSNAQTPNESKKTEL